MTNNESEWPTNNEWAATIYGIEPNDIVWYHSGICYDRIMVRTQEAADKVTAAVKGRHVNGGWLHGMELGGQTVQSSDGTIEVMC